MLTTIEVQSQTRKLTSPRTKQTPRGWTGGPRQTDNPAASINFLQRYLGNSFLQSITDTEGQVETGRANSLKLLPSAGVSAAYMKGLPASVGAVLHASGQPLDPTTRSRMESRFGYDFSQVRVHTDPRAAESARAVNALAYTVGRDVVFGVGQYTPQTSEGRRLLAHELTHVVQQGGLSGVSQAKLTVSSPGDTEEREADHMATTLGRDITSGSELYAPQSDMVRRLSGRAWTPMLPGVPPHISTGIRVARQKAPGGRATAFTVEERIRDELGLEIRADDAVALEKRRQRLRELFESVPLSQARGLYDRLRRGMKGDEFAKFFVIRLASETRDEMLGILQWKFSAGPTVPTPAVVGITRAGWSVGFPQLDDEALLREYETVIARLNSPESHPERAQDEVYLKQLEEEIDRRNKRRQEIAQMTTLLLRLQKLGEAAKGEGAGGVDFQKSVDEFKKTLKERMDALNPGDPFPRDLDLIMKALMLWSKDPGNQWGEGTFDSKDLVMTASDYATVPASQYKCNAYVAEAVYQSLGLVFKVHASQEQAGKYFPYQAREWGDPNVSLPNFLVTTTPAMGDIWSNGKHTGVYLGEYTGKKLYISARDDGDGIFGLKAKVQQEKGIQIKYLPDGGVYRHYTR